VWRSFCIPQPTKVVRVQKRKRDDCVKLLTKRRFDLAYFHFGDGGAELDAGLRDLCLECFSLGFEVRFIFVTSNPNKFVLRAVHPGADDGYAKALVERDDVLFEVREESIHLALVDRVNAQL